MSTNMKDFMKDLLLRQKLLCKKKENIIWKERKRYLKKEEKGKDI
jgi:hypothetical protein